MLFCASASAGEVTIIDAKATCREDTCRFDVTLEHADSGWDHYADRWRVLDPGGKLLGTRELAHPHVGEQPFTRSLGGVVIPSGVSRVIIEAHDSVHGTSENTFELELML
jgi:hypothetical protein